MTLLNEIGLDPGIDHMLAMQCIDEVHDKGGKVMPTTVAKRIITAVEPLRMN